LFCEPAAIHAAKSATAFPTDDGQLVGMKPLLSQQSRSPLLLRSYLPPPIHE
jgi:hypothetical protein